MTHLIGFILFWIGTGMLIALLFPKSFLLFMISICLMIVGYNLFCSCS
ncbi:MAG: hypothetical protein PHC41_01950 [Lachnospiraceae bacterium]|nr:hypothetical protein [Lachnospiraceae bacterium]MDD3614973.1 hypothetical protein [Lachnospiraceae bacterium]